MHPSHIDHEDLDRGTCACGQALTSYQEEKAGMCVLCMADAAACNETVRKRAS